MTACLLLISAALTSCGQKPAIPHGSDSFLLFTGTGTSPDDLAAIENILNSRHLDYAPVNSCQLNAMSETQISRCRLLIVGGGNFVNMGNKLTARTAANVRNAVMAGMNYVGICAGSSLRAVSLLLPQLQSDRGCKIRLLLRRKQWNPQGGGEYDYGCRAGTRSILEDGPQCAG